MPPTVLVFITIVCRLTIHDQSSAWAEGKELSNLLQCDRELPRSNAFALIIDSLSALLLHCPPPVLCRWLLSNQNGPSLCLLHSDLHDKGVLAQIEYIATSSMKLEHILTYRNDTTVFKGIVHTTHRKPSGTIVRQVPSYWLAHFVYNCVSSLNRLKPTALRVTVPLQLWPFMLHHSSKLKPIHRP